MLSVVEIIDLLEEVRVAAGSRDFRGVVQLIGKLPNELLVTEPEMGHYLAQAYSQLDRQREADALLTMLDQACVVRGNDRLLRRRLNLVAVSHVRHGNLAAAEAILRDVQLASDVEGDHKFLATATMNLGVVADIRCEWEKATSHYHYALVLFQRTGDRASAAACYHNLGMLHRQRGDLREAETYLERALDNYKPTGTAEERLSTDIERALTILDGGDLQRALALAENCAGRAKAMRNGRLVAECSRAIAKVLLEGDEVEQAEVQLLEALSVEAVEENPMLRAELLEELACAYQMRGADVRAQQLMSEAAACYVRLGSHVRAQRANDRLHSELRQ